MTEISNNENISSKKINKNGANNKPNQFNFNKKPFNQRLDNRASLQNPNSKMCKR